MHLLLSGGVEALNDSFIPVKRFLKLENAFFSEKYLLSMVGKYPISLSNKFIQQSLLIVYK